LRAITVHYNKLKLTGSIVFAGPPFHLVFSPIKG